MVLFVSGSVGAHFSPGLLGFPVAANAAHAHAQHNLNFKVSEDDTKACLT